MDKDYEKRINETKKKIQELDSKIAMRHIVSKLKYNNFKKVQLAVSLSAFALAIGLSDAGMNRLLNQNNESSVYSTIDEKNNLNNADDEVVVEYVKDSFSKFSDYISDDMLANEKIEALNVSYYEPVLTSYSNYKETNKEDDYKLFKKSVSNYEDRIMDYNTSLSFDNSIYKYAKYINGKVCIPYKEIIDNSTLPEGYEVYDNVVYVPIGSNENNKTFGND